MFDSLVTRSAAMETVLRSAQLIAQTDATVLITGESGTGKELVAKAIHDISPRSLHPFVTVNCAALPETLAESLLFGHRKGAFTGATQAEQGLVASAEGGTLFLDEIGELPPALQAKLLRFLESGEILPLGATQPVRINARVLAATHRDLFTMSQKKEFREDLYYRLMVVPVELPPLRERREDIELLSEHFFQLFSSQHGLPTVSINKEATKTLQQYRWPGNVRQLKNCCERLSILLAGKEIQPENLPQEIRAEIPGNKHHPSQQAGHSVASNETAFQLPETGLKLEDLERDLLFQALERTRNNKSHAARLLGISRDALNYRVRKFS